MRYGFKSLFKVVPPSGDAGAERISLESPIDARETDYLLGFLVGLLAGASILMLGVTLVI